MKITFHSIRFKNLLSTGNDFQSFKLDQNDFTVIVGANGCGKSTLIDAISYVLYNKPFRKIKLPQLVNSFNNKKLVVEIAFSIGGVLYAVRRGQKPKIFEIYKNKELIPEDPSGRDYQSLLEEEILQVDFKTFCQINIIGKATYTPFMSLTAAHRREVIEDLLDAKIFSQMSLLAKDDFKHLKDQLKDVDSDMRVINVKIENTEKILKQYQSDKSQELELKKQRFEQQIENFEQLRDNLLQYQNQYDEFVDNNQNIDVKKKEISDVITGLKTSLGIKNSELSKNNKIISNINDLEKCTICLQDVDENHKAHIVEDVNYQNIDINKDIQEIKSKLELAEIEYKNNHDLIDKRSELMDSITKLKGEIVGEKKNLLMWKEDINKLSEPVELPKDLDNIDDLKNQKQSIVEKYDGINNEIDIVKQSITLLGDGGIKTRLISKYISTINTKINKYLDAMDLFVQFELDEEFNEQIKSHYRDVFSYESFSEGQKLRIDLAIMLTWREISRMRNSTSTNLLILDEIIDGSMDASGVQDFLQILKAMDIAQNTFIISHSPDTIDGFENTIRAEMQGNFTVYKEI